MDKSLLTNALAALALLTGAVYGYPVLQSIGLFALSGAATNWLAVHMLFERVPGLYGSGVIPARFEDFKRGIKALMMEQFFTRANIERFLGRAEKEGSLHLAPVIEQVDFSPTFDSLIDVVEHSSFGNLLNMVGGVAVLEPLREPFIKRMKGAVVGITRDERFIRVLRKELDQEVVVDEITAKIECIVEQRLDELTPQLVKTIIQQMIREHLGWLVVWGGVFGGLIGLLAGLLGG